MSIVPVAFSFPHTTNPYPGKSCSSSLINRMNRLETVELRSAGQKEARTRYARMVRILNTYQTANRFTRPHMRLANKIAKIAWILLYHFLFTSVLEHAEERRNKNSGPLTLFGRWQGLQRPGKNTDNIQHEPGITATQRIRIPDLEKNYIFRRLKSSRAFTEIELFCFCILTD